MKLEHLKAGDVVVMDDGYDCMAFGRVAVQAGDQGKLFVPCADGRHFLVGQLRDDGTLSGAFWPGEIEEQAAFRARLEAAGVPAPSRDVADNPAGWVDAANGQSIMFDVGECDGNHEIVRLVAEAVNVAAWGACVPAGPTDLSMRPATTRAAADG